MISISILYEYLVPLIIIILWFYLTFSKKISKQMSIIWVISFFIALTWEVGNLIIGDKFLQIKDPDVKKYVPGPIYAISHAIQDTALFMIGVLIAYNLLGKDTKIFCEYNYLVLLIFIIWGFLQEFFVELAFNGKIWEYIPSKYNPTVWSNNNINYTLVPYLIWIIAPIIFWLVVVQVMKTSKKCKNIKILKNK